MYTDVEREGIPPSDADKQPVAPRGIQEEEDRKLGTGTDVITSDIISSVSFRSLTSAKSPTVYEKRYKVNTCKFRLMFSSHLDSDRSHRTVSQNFRNQSWSMLPDVLSHEMEENLQNVRVLDSDPPVKHLNEQKQFPDDSTPERPVKQSNKRTNI